MAVSEDDHYLKKELYSRIAREPALFEWLQSGSLDGIWYLDLENPEEEWYSDEFKRLFGYEPHEVPNKSSWWMENIHQEALDEAMEAWQKHVSDPSFPYDQIVRYWHKDGSLVWVRCRGLAIRDENGTAIRFLGAHTDVTDLASSRLRYDRLGLDLTDGLWEWDISTNQNYFSPAWVRALGYEPGELDSVVETWINLLHPDDKDRALEAATAHLKEGVPYNIDLRYLHKDGSIRWMKSRGAVLVWDKNGNPLKMMGTHTDITALQMSHDSLEALNEGLTKSNEDLKDFSYVVSHDLQEPLRMISSYVALFERKYSGKVDEKAEKYIKYISEGADRLNLLLEDLLRFSRLETTDEDRKEVDLDSILDSVLQDLEIMIKEKSVVVRRDPLCRVRGIKTQLGLVLQNLVSNAIKFCPSSPEIDISCSCYDGMLTVCVKDNGIGIDPKYRDQIFDIFSRLHTRSEYPGTGMGLAIVRRAIEKHGGEAWVESELGKGSSFYFTLPCAASPCPYAS